MTLAQHEDDDFIDKLFFWNETNNTMRLCIIQENKAMGSVLIRLQPPEEAAAADASPSKKRRRKPAPGRGAAPNYMEWDELQCDIGKVYYIVINKAISASDCDNE